jgi:hypothetical protein
MRFFELEALGEVPKKAGEAELIFEMGVELPFRDGNKITIPATETGLEMFQLMPSWEQFLIWNGKCFFGGTDEQPFLVELDTDVVDRYIESGIEGVYDFLLPSKIIKLAEEFEVELKRQGDIFAMPLKWDRERMNDLHLMLYGERMPPAEGIFSETEGNNLFGTRHVLGKGSMFEMELWKNSFTVVENATICAPDHRDMKLPGLHIVEQGSGLYSPKEAD